MFGVAYQSHEMCLLEMIALFQGFSQCRKHVYQTYNSKYLVLHRDVLRLLVLAFILFYFHYLSGSVSLFHSF